MLRRLVLATLLIGGASAAPAAAAGDVPCSQEGIATTLAMQDPKYAEVTEGGYGGIGQILCADVTGDGTKDALYSLLSGGTGGAFNWGLVVGDGEQPRVATVGGGYKLAVALLDGKVQTGQPVYRRGDANCCPRGGFRIRTYRWNGTRLALASNKHVKTLPRRFSKGY